MTPTEYLHQIWEGEANFAPYFMLFLRPWMLLGDNQFVTRLGSVLWAVATVPVVYWLGLDLFGRRAGYYAAAIFAVSTFQIRYAQWARGYTMLMFLAALATFLLVRAIQRPGVRLGAAYVAVSVLMVYTHFLGVLLLFAHAVVILLLPRDRISWRGAALCAGCIGFLLLPAAYYVTNFNRGQLRFVDVPNIYIVYRFMVNMAGGRPLLVLFVGLTFVAVWVAWRDRTHEKIWPIAFSGALLAVPTLTSYAISQVQPIFVDRYLIFAQLGWILMVSAGLAAVSRKILRIILIPIFCGLLLFSNVSYHLKYRALQDWQSATNYVLDRWQPTDGLLFYYGFSRMPFELYADHLQPGLTDAATLFPAGWGLAHPAHTSVPESPFGVRWNAHPASRVWLVRCFDKRFGRERVAAELERQLNLTYELKVSEVFTGDIRVQLYVPKECAASKNVLHTPSRGCR